MSMIIQKKICMLGDFAVGKTSLVRRFVEGRFDDRYLSTIGVKVSRRIVKLSEQTTVRLLLWDLAGSEEFTGVQSSYLQGSAGALLVCDLTRKSTLDSLMRYARRLHEVRPQAQLIIVGNKNDLTEERSVSDEDLITVATEIQAEWLTTSAKSGENVEKAFVSLAQNTLKV